MACTPETKFDSFTKMLASGVSRRDAMKWVGAATLGAMLTTAGVKQAEAGPNKVCKGQTNCIGTPCNNCSSGLGCFCFVLNTKPKSKCLQNAYCASISSCSKNKDCNGGKCICPANGCGQSVCLNKCTSCPTGVSGASGTAAGK